ncbi:MAG: hypothetical protein ACI9O4_002046 [Chitinophagales bacterium]|jgi:hypothetical protein
MRNQDNWKLYYTKTSGKPARETLLKALNSFKKEGVKGMAFELGSGACNDVRLLSEQGWKVTAVDNEVKAQLFFNKEFKEVPNVDFQLASFEEVKWHKVHLVHAGFALAFCPKPHFKEVIRNIQSNILNGGRFAGNFFGTEHSWNHLCLVSRAEIEGLFEDFEIEWVEETKTQRLSTFGEELFHHNINLIAKKTGLKKRLP